MILKSLYDYAQAKAGDMPPQGMEWKEIEFVIVIDADGRFVRFESRRIDKKKCASFLVAKGVKRTSAPKPNILWDNGKYVLGKGDKAAKAYGMFVDTIKNLATAHPQDTAIRAVHRFYTSHKESNEELMGFDPLIDTINEGLAANFSFRLSGDEELLAEKTYLYRHLIGGDDKGEVVGRCLVTGASGPIVRTMTATPLPENSPMASLVSFQVNSGYDSYGKTQLYNAPISKEAEEAISTVLKKFLGKESHNKVRLGNRMLLFWGDGKSDVGEEVEDSLLGLFEFPDIKAKDPDAKVDKVKKLLKGVFSGEVRTTLDDRFHILGLAPNTGRIAVVMWMDAPLREFAGNILRHFDDMEIVDNRNPDKRRPYVGVYSMISSATMGGKVSDALPRLVEETIKAVINGTPYPFPLYSSTLQRIRAELPDMGVTVQRAALLKAYINRKTNNLKQSQPLTVMLDKTNTNAGYLCGRLTAVLEKIQSDINSGDSIRTRYMGAASTTPAAVLPAMLNLSLHHSEKLSEGSRIFYETLKQEIMDKISEKGFPAHLDLNDQGRFFVGYYHQRTDLYTKKEK